jgi:hypothetical protein
LPALLRKDAQAAEPTMNLEDCSMQAEDVGAGLFASPSKASPRAADVARRAARQASAIRLCTIRPAADDRRTSDYSTRRLESEQDKADHQEHRDNAAGDNKHFEQV